MIYALQDRNIEKRFILINYMAVYEVGKLDDNVIEAINLTKKYGSFTALSDLNLNLSGSKCVGFLGPNGAGKTTTIKMLTTLLQPTSGSARIAGYNIKKDSNNVRKSIGIVFQDPSLDDELTGRENLEFHAILYNIGKEQRDKKIKEVLKLVELEDKADTFVCGSSPTVGSSRKSTLGS